jgi:glycosyltransferase involved in cell wall biosynthesis
MIVACLCVANEERLIAEAIRSVKAYVDRFVIVDSIFVANEAVDSPHSTDATRAIAERVCAPVPLTYIESQTKLDQPTARNRYLDELAEDDWALIIDGDEVLMGDLDFAAALFRRCRERRFPPSWDALSMRVYTTAVLAEGLGKDLDPDTYATAPLVQTSGWMPRLVRKRAARGWRYRVNAAGIPHGMYDSWTGQFVGKAAIRTNAVFMVNQHTRQSHDEYVADCIRELRERGKL